LSLFSLVALGVGMAIGGLVGSAASLPRLLLVILGLVVVGAAIARRDCGLLALVFMTYTRFSDALVHTYGMPSIAQPFIFLLLVSIVVRWGVAGIRPVGWERAAVLLLAYGLAGLASLLYATDTVRAQEALVDYGKDALIVLIVTTLLQGVTMVHRVIWALLAAGIFLGTISVYQYLTGTLAYPYWGFGQAEVMHIVGKSSGYRLGGPLGSANAYAQILLVLIPLAFNRLWYERAPGGRLLAAWALGVCGLALVFTFSRGAFVALLVALGIMVVRQPPRPLSLLLTTGLLVPLLLLVPGQYTERLKTLVSAVTSSGQRSDASMRGRWSETLVGWRMFLEHPLVGVGWHNSFVHYRRYAKQVGLDSRHEDRGTHNLYLQIAAETGLLGLSVFAALLCSMFRSLQRAGAHLRSAGMPDMAEMVAAFGIGLVGYLTHSLVIHAAFPRFFWLLFGIAMALPAAVQHSRSPALAIPGVGKRVDT
jgi:O-antigen ligase